MRKFFRDKRGNVGIIFGLVMTPLVAFAGAAIDYSQAIKSRTQLQSAADSASLAGASLPANSDRVGIAKEYFANNLAATPLSSASSSISVSGSTVTLVTVNASFPQPTPFLGLIGYATIPITVRSSAAASIYNGGVACLLALDPSMSASLSLVGVSQLDSNCWAWVNSNSSSAIDATGTSTATAQGFCTAGQVIGSSHLTPSAITGCKPLADPFSRLNAPSSAGSGCTYNNTVLKNGTYTISPGIYCGGLSLMPKANVTFLPGVYIIRGGVLDIQAQASATGNGVLFYFTGSNTGLIVIGGGSANFTAPAASQLSSADSSLAGFLFIQDRTSNPGATVVIQGGGSVNLQGVLYTPTWQVSVGGHGDLNANSNFWVMVANSFSLAGNGELYIKSNAAAAGLPNPMPPIPSNVVLTE